MRKMFSMLKTVRAFLKRDIDMHPEASGSFAKTGYAEFIQKFLDHNGNLNNMVKGNVDRIKVDDHIVRMRQRAEAGMPGIDLDAAQIIDIGKRIPVLAKEVMDHSMRTGIYGNGFDPVGYFV